MKNEWKEKTSWPTPHSPHTLANWSGPPGTHGWEAYAARAGRAAISGVWELPIFKGLTYPIWAKNRAARGLDPPLDPWKQEGKAITLYN
jgi:hypothetical protein